MLVNFMEEAEQTRGKEHLPPQVDGFSRDLLLFNNFSGKSEIDNGEEEEEEGVELSLGLSLNGRFGVDPKRANNKIKLMRSSSVSTFVFGGRSGGEESHAPVVPVPTYTTLWRTCSMPTETEEEWRKRKEVESLRRMEAKRRRMDKMKFWRVGREKVDSEENSGEENGSNGNISSNYCQGLDSINGKSSQGSIGSQGSGSSGISEFESQLTHVNKKNDSRSPSTGQALQARQEQKPQMITGSVVDKAADKGAKDAKEMLKNGMLDMPCVTTTGNGPNGKKIDGFLYRYRKGEEVRIVCVCHGRFLSPAEFVKHAGGTEVEHPLRHIVVNPSPLL